MSLGLVCFDSILKQMKKEAAVYFGQRHFLVVIIMLEIAECKRLLHDPASAIAILKDARVRAMEHDAPNGKLRSRCETDLTYLLQKWGDLGDCAVA